MLISIIWAGCDCNCCQTFSQRCLCQCQCLTLSGKSKASQRSRKKIISVVDGVWKLVPDQHRLWLARDKSQWQRVALKKKIIRLCHLCQNHQVGKGGPGAALDFSLFLIRHSGDATNSKSTSPSWNIQQQIFTIFTFASQHQRNFEGALQNVHRVQFVVFFNLEKHFLPFYRLFNLEISDLVSVLGGKRTSFLFFFFSAVWEDFCSRVCETFAANKKSLSQGVATGVDAPWLGIQMSFPHHAPPIPDKWKIWRKNM